VEHCNIVEGGELEPKQCSDGCRGNALIQDIFLTGFYSAADCLIKRGTLSAKNSLYEEMSTSMALPLEKA